MDSYKWNNSQTPPSNVLETPGGSREILLVMTVYISFLSVTGFIGNILVIVSVAISPRLRTSSYAFIVNLSLADLSVNVLAIPLVIVSYYNYGWPYDMRWCRWVFYLFLIGTGVSLCTITSVAASRYCFVSLSGRTYRKYCGVKAATVLVAINWSISILVVLVHHWGQLGGIHYHPVVGFCFLDVFDDDDDDVTYGYVIVAVVVATCFILIPCLYCMTFRTLFISQRRVHAPRRNLASIRRWRQILHPAEVKLTKMVALIFVLLLFCWTPILVTHVVDTNPHFQRLGVMLVLTNSSINPFVYAWLNEHFKRAFKRILLCGKRQGARITPLIL